MFLSVSCGRHKGEFVLHGTVQDDTDSILVVGLDSRFDRTDTIICNNGVFKWSFRPDTATALIRRDLWSRELPLSGFCRERCWSEHNNTCRHWPFLCKRRLLQWFLPIILFGIPEWFHITTECWTYRFIDSQWSFLRGNSVCNIWGVGSETPCWWESCQEHNFQGEWQYAGFSLSCRFEISI